MELPAVEPIEENYLCRDRKEFEKLVKRVLASKGEGAFIKVFGKVDGKPYYVTLLLDKTKILAVEVQDISGGSLLVGEDALKLLKKMLDNPTIVDAYPLSDVELKMSIVENIDVYNSTPKIAIKKLGIGTSEKSDVESPSVPKSIEEKIRIAEKILEEGLKQEEKHSKPKRVSITLNVPLELDPYFRALANKLVKYAKSLGMQVTHITISAREVRYALGAGTGIHTTIEVQGKSSSLLSPQRMKQLIEEFLYREAGELSKELGKRVVISHVEVKV